MQKERRRRRGIEGKRTLAALVFFRRKQDAVQQRAHTPDSHPLDGLPVCAAQGSAQPRFCSKSSWAEADSGGFPSISLDSRF
jgi:hypothetical protein